MIFKIADIVVGKERKTADVQRVKDLAQSIQAVGLLNPITISANNELIAGLHRLEACKSLGHDKVEVVQLSLDEIKREMATIDENLIRKHLTDLEVGDLLNRRDELLTALGVRAKAGHNQHKGKHGNIKTTKQIATEIGMGERNAQRKKQIAKNLNPEVKGKIMNTPLGNKVTALLEISKLPVKQQMAVVADLSVNAERADVMKEIKRVKREESIRIVQQKASKFNVNKGIELIAGDFRAVCKDIPDNSIDAIITDPPYPKEFLDLWEDLGVVANRVLKPGGFLIAYTGKTYLPTVLNHVLDGGLEFYWLFTLLFRSNKKTLCHHRNIIETSRPIVIFSKPPMKVLPRMVGDTIECNSIEKDFHDWQQSVKPFQYLIKHFTKPNDKILDPFICTGTTALASLIEERRCMGIDVNAEMVEVAKGRIQEYLKGNKKVA